MTTPHRLPVRLLLLPIVAIALLTLATRQGETAEAAAADEAETADGEQSTPQGAKPAAADQTIDIKAETLKLEITLEGVVEATCTRQIAVRPEAWAELSVLSAVEHGRRVGEGTVLVKFDTRKIDIAIADLEAELKASQLAFQQAEAALTVLKTSTQHSLVAAKRSAAEAAEDLSRFRKIDRPLAIKDINETVTNAENSLVYQMEELRQLEKMYAADDLTEETEEIILTRARNRVRYYQHSLKKTIAERDKYLDITLPRRAVGLQQAAETSALALAGAKSSLPATVAEKTLALARLKTGLGRSRERLARLRRDREQLTVVSPAAGIVYYGQAARGKWPEVPVVQKLLRPGGTAKPNQVLMTIVCPGDLVVRTAIAEKDIAGVKPGDPGAVVAKAFPDTTFDARLAQVARIPFADGKYDATVELSDDLAAKRLAPGMNCSVKITTYEKEDTILIPKSAVAIGKSPRAGKVTLVADGGKAASRKVKLGRTVGDRIEVLSGLSPGDRIRKQ